MAVITSAIYMLMPSLDAVQIAQPGRYLTRISTAGTHLRGQRTRGDHHGPAEQEAYGAWSTCSPPPARGPESHQSDRLSLSHPLPCGRAPGAALAPQPACRGCAGRPPNAWPSISKPRPGGLGLFCMQISGALLPQRDLLARARCLLCLLALARRPMRLRLDSAFPSVRGR